MEDILYTKVIQVSKLKNLKKFIGYSNIFRLCTIVAL